jgi:hypothetical protein
VLPDTLADNMLLLWIEVRPEAADVVEAKGLGRAEKPGDFRP